MMGDAIFPIVATARAADWHRPEASLATRGRPHGSELAPIRRSMRLEPILARCEGLEERAAAVYRAFAASARERPELCALWTDMAREEEQHAASIARARDRLRLSADPRLAIDGWEEAIAEVAERLGAAERLGIGASPAEQLAAALDLEMTEVDAMRHVILTAAHSPDEPAQESHASRLASAAEALTNDPQVRLQVALLRARTRLQPRT
jgi:rubrerythrin